MWNYKKFGSKAISYQYYNDYSGNINNPSFPEKYLLIADYSPLSGGGSGFSYRPPRRGMLYW